MLASCAALVCFEQVDTRATHTSQPRNGEQISDILILSYVFACLCLCKAEHKFYVALCVYFIQSRSNILSSSVVLTLSD